MSSVTIPFFVKVFKQSEHAKRLMNGEIHANPLSYFRGIEDDARNDRYEGAFLIDPPDLTMSLWPTDPAVHSELGTLHLKREDIGSPLAMFPKNFERFNLFCMYAKIVNEDDFPNVGTDHLHELKKLFEVPTRLTDFGEHAVVIRRPRTFIDRVTEAAMSAGYDFGQGAVQYKNPREAWPATDPYDARVIFLKREKYAPENEYRLVFGRRLYSDTPIRLQIGDLSDIAYRADVSFINQGIQVRMV